MAFEWDLFIYKEDEMIIKIIPYYQEKFSQTSYGKDELVFKINPNIIVRSKETGLTLKDE